MNSRPRIKTSIVKMNIEVLKYVFKFCPLLVAFAFLNIIASIVVALSEVYIIAEAIEIVVNSANLNILYKSLIIYGVIIAICYGFKIFYNRFLMPKYRIVYFKKIQSFLFKKVKHIDMASYDDPVFYDKFSRALRDSTWRGIAVFNTFVDFIQSISIAIALGAYVVITDIWLLFIILLGAIVNVIVVNITNKIWYKVYRETEKDRRFYFYVSRTFYQQRFAAEIKTTPISKLLIDRFDEKAMNIEKVNIKAEKKLMVPNSIYYLSHYLLEQGGAYIYLTYRLINGLSVALFTATINATFKFSSNFVNAISIYTSMREHSYYINDFMWIVNYKPKIEKNEGIKEIGEFKDLKINDICFRYPQNTTDNIKNISLDLTKGEKIAIVGDNGGGKTTLMKLLLKFYNPTSGNILYNGFDLREYNENSIRKEYSIIFQDFQIYAVTVAENVLMRRVNDVSDKEKVKKALENVGLLDKVMAMKDGIYTQVTREFDKEGATFSGGENQRLAISRVFASDASIYILDEPTSSLDPLSEERINKLIIKNVTNKTMIIIAHRLSTVVDVDKIYLLREGEIKEAGSHEELMRLKGHYYKMFTTQKRMYEKQD